MLNGNIFNFPYFKGKKWISGHTVAAYQIQKIVEISDSFNIF